MTAFYIGATIVVLYIIAVYNGLAAAQQKVKEGWSDVDTQLKRRYDLIPNLVNTVKGYAQHEQETFAKITEARTAAMSAGNGAARSEAENILTSGLKSVFALSENYPDLKANQNFLQLQEELADTENKIQASRRFYNSMVLALNTKIATFPSNLLAAVFHFEKAAFFELSEEEKKLASEPVKVSF